MQNILWRLERYLLETEEKLDKTRLPAALEYYKNEQERTLEAIETVKAIISLDL